LIGIKDIFNYCKKFFGLEKSDEALASLVKPTLMALFAITFSM